MGGRRGRRLLLGLLLLISGALPPGYAEGEMSAPPTDPSAAADPSAAPPTESPADPRVAPTIPLLLNSSESPDWRVSSSVSMSPDSTPEALGNEVTEQPPPLATPTDNSGSNVTAAPRDVTGGSDPSLTSPVTDSSDTTSANATQPPMTTAAPSTAHNTTVDSAAETPSVTLRATAKTKPSDDSTPYTTTSMSIHSTRMPATTVTSPATQSSRTATAPHTTRAEVQQGSSVLEVGDEKDPTSHHSRSSSNPLFVMIVSIFTVMVVMVVVVVGFHRYKKKNSRSEFRRLQDLPMDDMMEDTPLSLYSY